MKRVIHFSRARYFFFAFSALLILIGVTGYIVNHGLNLGVDFKAGIAFQFQVAPESFTVIYNGPDTAEISIPAGEQALTAAGDIIFKVTSAADGNVTSYPFSYKDYATVQDLVNAIGTKVPGVTATLKGDPGARPTELLPLVRPAVIKGAEAAINLAPGPGRGVETSITEMRGLLANMGENTIQVVNPPESQEYIARFPVLNVADEAQFQVTSQAAMLKSLEAKFQPGQIIIKSTEFVGARMAQSLASQTIWLVLIALVLILVYMVIRFHPWIYGVAAVLGIMHDALVMLAFDAVFRIEIDAGTIAAILTILGYSINDTIVNFDRARENITLMRGDNLRNILDTSVTQTLSRTFITSGATLLTVVALVILTTGSIQNFAKNMTVGIIEGTYSTFISAFIVIQWNQWAQKRRKGRDLAKYGIVASTTPELETAGARRAAADGGAAGEAADEVEPEAVPGAFATEAQLEAGTPVGEIPQGEGAPVDGQHGGPQPGGSQPGGPQAQAARPAGAQGASQPNVLTFPGSQGSRKHKKHRRRHH